MDIEVNPRYGTLEHAQRASQPLVSGGLASTADQLRDQG